MSSGEFAVLVLERLRQVGCEQCVSSLLKPLSALRRRDDPCGLLCKLVSWEAEFVTLLKPCEGNSWQKLSGILWTKCMAGDCNPGLICVTQFTAYPELEFQQWSRAKALLGVWVCHDLTSTNCSSEPLMHSKMTELKNSSGRTQGPWVMQCLVTSEQSWAKFSVRLLRLWKSCKLYPFSTLL